jgi:hypothetical protein
VLLALIDVDRGVFSIDTATLKQLKSEGVSDTVIVAMIRSGREPQVDVTPPLAQEPPTEPVAQDASEPVEMDAPPAAAAPQFVPYLVPVPVYIAVPVAASSGKNHHASAQHPRTAAPTPCFVSTIPQWGFGGRIGPPPAAGCK